MPSPFPEQSHLRPSRTTPTSLPRPWLRTPGGNLSAHPVTAGLFMLPALYLLFLAVSSLQAPWLLSANTSITSIPSPYSKEIFSRPGCSLKERVVQRARLHGSCWAKRERDCFSPPPQGPAMGDGSSLLKEKLRQYETRQRRCTASVKDWAALIAGEEAPPDATCQYVIGHPQSQGIGNRLESVVSIFLYALLTERTLLVHDSEFLRLLCDPFPNATWRLPESAEQKVQEMVQQGPHFDNFYSGGEGGNASQSVNHIFVDLAYIYSHGGQNVYCDNAQEALKRVQSLLLRSEQFFAPGLFLIPSFRGELEGLFPDRAPFFHLARYIVNPNNQLWEKIVRLYESEMMHVNRRVGVQIRQWASRDKDVKIDFMMHCITNITKVLPPPISSEEWSRLWRGEQSGDLQFKWTDEDRARIERVIINENPERVLLLVTSLQPHHPANFRKHYRDGVAEDGSIVTVLSLSSDQQESHYLSTDEEALTEIFLLSFCDVLFTTFFSTFGYAAAGLQGRPQYLVDVYATVGQDIVNGQPACARVESGEPCFHYPPHERSCGAGVPDTSIDPPYLLPCRDTENGRGRRMWNPEVLSGV